MEGAEVSFDERPDLRLINLARALVTAGWLTEAAAWTHVLPAARRLQREYRSWEELFRNFMLGRH